MFLVTDTVHPVGASMTSFRLFGEEIRGKDGGLHGPDGTVAGSILTMNRTVKIVNELVRVSLYKATAMVTIDSAVAAEIDHQKGCLQPGKDANIVICDHALNVRKVIVRGRVVYERPS